MNILQICRFSTCILCHFGKILAKIGAEERVVGANSLIYCPSNVRHSIKNVGKTVAQVLRMSGPRRQENGGPVYSKKPSGQLGVREWKLADSKPEKPAPIRTANTAPNNLLYPASLVELKERPLPLTARPLFPYCRSCESRNLSTNLAC